MRHMMRSAPTVTHIFPRTMNVMPPNIFFCSTRGRPASASSTRVSSTSSAGMFDDPLAGGGCPTRASGKRPQRTDEEELDHGVSGFDRHEPGDGRHWMFGGD